MWLLLRLCFSAEPEDILVKMPCVLPTRPEHVLGYCQTQGLSHCMWVCVWCMHMCVYRRVNIRCTNKGEFIWFVKYLRNRHWSLLNWEVSFLWGINMKLFHFSPVTTVRTISVLLPTLFLPSCYLLSLFGSITFWSPGCQAIFQLQPYFFFFFQISPFVSQHWLDLQGGSGLSLTILYSTLSCSLSFPCWRSREERGHFFLIDFIL